MTTETLPGIKNLINDKKILYKKHLRSGKNTKVFEEFKLLQNKIVNLTNDSRDRYYTRISNKLNESHVFPKAYWSILKIFLNNKKPPIIPPLFYENRFVTDFKKKAELFNSFLLNSALHLITAAAYRLSSCLKQTRFRLI